MPHIRMSSREKGIEENEQEKKQEEGDDNDDNFLLLSLMMFKNVSNIGQSLLFGPIIWILSVIQSDNVVSIIAKRSFQTHSNNCIMKNNHSKLKQSFTNNGRRKLCFIVFFWALFYFPCVAIDKPQVLTAAATAGDGTTKTPPVQQTTTYNHPFLVLCTVDGNILVLNAHNGELACAFSSGIPLVGPSEPLSEQDRRIVPCLDGRLYVTSSDDGVLNPLEITVFDVLANPVKTCKDTPSAAPIDDNLVYDDESSTQQQLTIIECGIVTATKSTSLFALDAITGRLVWNQHPNGTTSTTDNPASHTVLLQR
jgi:outer membrane protein assembly factor BamB